jgi:SAM-dependent methyltransferase
MTDTIDEAAEIQAFAGEIMGFYRGAMITYMIDLGERTGLFDAAARGPATSTELAARAALEERYVREWLASLTTAGVFDYDTGSGEFSLLRKAAACLTGAHSMAPFSTLNTLLAQYVGDVEGCFRKGGGIPYDRYRPVFTDVMDAFSRHGFDAGLVDGLVPAVPGLAERLATGARVVDVGCGTGHAMIVLAGAFPSSQFFGYDIAGDAIDKARAEAMTRGLPNAHFEVRDAGDLAAAGPFDVVFSFDAIHDQRDPAGVVSQIQRSLVEAGSYIMVEPAAQSTIEDNLGSSVAPWLYAVSTLHCVPVSLAEGGPALGTVWGENNACSLLAQTGFVDIQSGPAPHDPLAMMIVSRKPTSAV